MLFSSFEFLFFFLPLSAAGYFLCPLKLRNGWLLLVSLIFYGFGEPVYVFLMIVTVVADYLFGLAIERTASRKKLWLWLSVAFNLSLLGFFKYYGFFSSLFSLPKIDVPLPIGISFYTFQALSYVIDVYREQVSAEKNIVSFGAYVTLFPQLIAGPIVKYSDVSRELAHRKHTAADIADGIARFSAGLSKKAILANGAGELSDKLFARGDSSGALWLGLILYAFQIYYDFSGYSDMAIGLGKIFGFRFPENFNYPYISKSITEFWRRWHITLSSWFREYLYIPLGGNRKGKPRTYLNLFIVWSLTGLWHGAALNFILWGIYFFVLLVLEKAFLGRLLERLPRALRHAYALFFILIGWLIFSADGASVGELIRSLAGLFGVGIPLADDKLIYLLSRNLPFILIMSVGATPVPKKIFALLGSKRPHLTLCVRDLLSVGGLLLSVAYIVGSDYNPFLYFRF